MAEPLPEWFLAPEGGWKAEDLDRLPPGTPRLELIDGAPIVRSPQVVFHSAVMRRLANALELTAPPELGVQIEMSIVLGKRQRPEPDIVVYRKAVSEAEAHRRTFYLPEDVVLAVEIVSDESYERDHETKPIKYAKAGIPHFWLVEDDGAGQPVVHVYELDSTTASYVPTGIMRDRLKVAVPYRMEFDLASLVR
ncbi:MAG: hypothetical protein JWN00_1256 [Actinomycetia bacterium]|nr:hypothetical protein [Actinomycetes bacterium]